MNPTMKRRPYSLRLKGHDYSLPGLYFITLCLDMKQLFFADINVDEMSIGNGPIFCMNARGTLIRKHWLELNAMFRNTKTQLVSIMPDHIHGIIEILDVAPSGRAEQSPAPTVSGMICAFKSITTKALNSFENTPGRKFWQRGFYDHIIRSDIELHYICKYIKENPNKWKEHEYYLFTNAFQIN